LRALGPALPSARTQSPLYSYMFSLPCPLKKISYFEKKISEKKFKIAEVGKNSLNSSKLSQKDRSSDF
jgi:hypothetical protein